MARQFARTPGATFAGFRISNITGPPGDDERLPTFQSNLRFRRWNLWGYVDARDVAHSCRLDLSKRTSTAPRFLS